MPRTQLAIYSICIKFFIFIKIYKKLIIDNHNAYQTNHKTIITAAIMPTNDKKERPSPTESATSFDEGTRRMGNDGNMYVVATDKNGKHRWAKYKGDDTTETQVDKEVIENAPKRKAQPKKPKKKATPNTSDTSDKSDVSDSEKKPKAKGKKSVKPKTPEIATETENKEKKKYDRKAPKKSAKNYEVGDTAIGLDGNMYIVKETKNEQKRWFPNH